MTTVAFDGETLAADRQMSFHSVQVNKIYRLRDGSLAGGCGTMTLVQQLIRWLDGQGPAPDPSPEKYTVLHISKERGKPVLRLSVDGKVPIILRTKRFAIGSGSDYAMGAMDVGANAARAIRIASKYDPATGRQVDSMKL